MQEIIIGDILYIYETPSQAILWKSSIKKIVKFSYDSKRILRETLISELGLFDETSSYYVNAKEHGYCFAFKVTPLRKMRLAKPKTLRFPQQGWLRVDQDVALGWLHQIPMEDDVVLDNLAAKGNLIEQLRRLNKDMAGISPERVRRVVSQTIRRDTKSVKTLKSLCEYHCQFPGCTATIIKRNGGLYVEVAHVEPVHKGGQNILGNLIVLCPNHHKELDYGKLEILEQSMEQVRGYLNGKTFDIRLPSSK